MEEVKNAVITGAEIMIEDRGLLTAWLRLDYGNVVQGFGGYALYLPEGFKNHQIESVAGNFIYRVMQVAGAPSWSGVVGKSIRVKMEDSKVLALGHITHDVWFSPKEEWKKDEAGA